MVNAQTWLDQTYPKEKRSEVGEIYIDEQLEGELDLVDFIYWNFKVSISHHVDKSRFEVKRRHKKEDKIKDKIEIPFPVNIASVANDQNYLNQHYPTKEEREKEKSLFICDGDLIKRNLDLSDFINLEVLEFCDNSLLTGLNLQNNKKLEDLIIAGTNLNSLDVSNLTKLQRLVIRNNRLENLNISGCFKLKKLECYNNPIANFVYSPSPNDYPNLKRENFQWTNDAQEWLNWSHSLEIRKDVKELDISSKELKGKLDLLDFVNLEKLSCRRNQLTSLDISKCSSLVSLDCSRNQITSLDLNENKQLSELNCSDNKLEKIDLISNRNLTNVDFSNNQLTNLVLSNCSDIIKLDCQNNFLTALDLNSEKLEKLNCLNNNFSKQDLSFFTNLVNLKYLAIGTNDEKRIEKSITMLELNVSNL